MPLKNEREKTLTFQFLILLLYTYFMSERVLFQVVRLDELHPTLTADVRSDVFVFHHVVLKLTGILESLLALCTPAHTATNICS